MNDADLIKMLRQRLSTVETAIGDFLAAMEQTGQKRMDAFAEACTVITAHAPRTDAAVVQAALRRFFFVYGETLEPRKAALQHVMAALQVDFETALLCAPDMDDAQRVRWLSAKAANEPREEERSTTPG